MCVPIAVAALFAIQAAAQASTQMQQARQQRNALGEQYAAQQQEIASAASARAGTRVQQARAERARLTTAAGESGVSGVSLGDLLYTSGLQESSDVAMIGKDAFYQARGSRASYAYGLAGAQGPSPLEAGLGIATAAMGGYNAGAEFKARQLNPPPGGH